jgi:hypothetical protein
MQERWNRMLSGRTHAEHPPVPLERGSSLRGLERTLSTVPAAFWIGALVVVSAAFRFLNARTSATPWILPDEYVYADLSRNFADSGHFLVNGAPMAAWSNGPLYTILLAPVWALTDSATQAYAAAQLVNSLLMSSTAVFAYLLARRVLDKRLALFLAVLTVLVPSMVYSSKLMTESLAYPAFMAAVLAITRVLERPSNGRQLVALLAIGVAALARVEMIVLIPALATAVVLVAALLDHGWVGAATFWQRLLRFRLTIFLFAAGAVAFLAIAALEPGFLGGHARSLHGFDLLGLPRWLLIYLGDLDLYVGVIPFAAFIVMVALAFRADLPRAARILLFSAGSTFAWLVLFVAAYSTAPRPAPAVQDRLLFYVIPLELLAFLLWIQVGLPRPRRFALPAAGLALATPLFIPYADFLSGRAWGVSSGTVALVPWGLLRPALGTGAVLLAIILALTLGATAAFMLLSPRRASVLRMIVVTNFLLITMCVLTANSVVAGKASDEWVAPDPNWITAAVGPDARVAGVWALPDRPISVVPADTQSRINGLLENAFYRSGTEVYAFGNAHDLLWGWPPVVKQARADEGTIVDASGAPIRADYAIVGPELPVRGREVARDANTGLVLYELDEAELRLR